MTNALFADLGGQAVAFFKVVMVDLTMAGDNAVAVGLAAAGLPEKERRRAIVLGLSGAVVMLIGFALITVQLLKVVGLLLAGGFLLLWVCWKMWRELRDHDHANQAEGEAALEDATGASHHVKPHKGKPKTMWGALLTILIADLSMSLDNVLAVAGAAREHPAVLIFGLILSISLMGLAATFIARLLMKWRWLGYIGLAIIFYVSMSMIWEGHRQVVVDLDRTASYNAALPGFLQISPEEADELHAH